MLKQQQGTSSGCTVFDVETFAVLICRRLAGEEDWGGIRLDIRMFTCDVCGTRAECDVHPILHAILRHLCVMGTGGDVKEGKQSGQGYHCEDKSA